MDFHLEWSGVFRSKPVIGIAGGIGSGKSFVAGLFGELGCKVISADEQVREAYQDPQVKQTLHQWWGDEIFKSDGQVNKVAIGAKVFNQPEEKHRLEQLLHPMVNEARQRLMREADLAQVVAFVWDTPLLFETGLNRQCDAVVFVDSPRKLRLGRVLESRRWNEAELDRREKLQMPLDKKREISDYVIRNTADAPYARGQVREVLSRILAGSSQSPPRS